VNDDDLVPVSVRLGDVVPPEDPEDWTRPLTWVAAAGMLAGPLTTLGWFIAAPPTDGAHAVAGTFVVGATLAAGAAATGATQLGMARAWTATLGAGLFGTLVIIILGAAMAGERQVGTASPTLSHAFAAAVGGLLGSGAAALVAALLARLGSRVVRFLPALLAGVAVALAAVATIQPPT
jgi:hypothetical protein